jgi:ribose transport system substrate-binding protein
MKLRRNSIFAITAASALMAVGLAGCSSDDATTSTETTSEESATVDAAEESAGGEYVIGVSNTLVGNGWREQMICSIKAQSLASGEVSKVIVANENGGPTEQIGQLRDLISQGVDAIILNPTDAQQLNPIIDEAVAQGIVVVAVDSAVSTENAYVATNNQEEYGYLGAKALFEAMGGKGNVIEMRGIDGVPADVDRHAGFNRALSEYPDVRVSAETFTGWDFTQGAQQALDLINSGQQIDGVWTSGIDYPVVSAFIEAGKKPVPVVGADNNEFINQTISLAGDGFQGIVVTNPAVIGAVGTSIALDALNGKSPNKMTSLTPNAWTAGIDLDTLKKFYFADQPPTYSSGIQVEGYTTYTPEQLFACMGPGE